MPKSIHLSPATLLIPSLNIWPRNWRQFYDNCLSVDIDKQCLYEILLQIQSNNMSDQEIIQFIKDKQQYFKQCGIDQVLFITRNKKIDKFLNDDDFIHLRIIRRKTIRTICDAI